jgi:DNA modification methylase
MNKSSNKVIDLRNKFNSLSGKEWLKLTTSVWFSKSVKYPQLDKDDVSKLTSMFSQDNSNVFINGIGSEVDSKFHSTDIEYLDYCLINLIPSNYSLVEINKYFASRINNLLSLIPKIKEKKYISIAINNYFTGSELIDYSILFSDFFSKHGFRFKGRINIIFEKGSKYTFKNKNFEDNQVFILNFKRTNESISNDFSLKNYIFPNVNGNKLFAHDGVSTFSNFIISNVKMDKIGKIHPAPFSYNDISAFIKNFSNQNELVLDPFMGVGSTMIAAYKSNRKSIGIDLNPNYYSLSKERFEFFNMEKNDYYPELKLGDANKILDTLSAVDYIITSPPYHNILKNKGKGIRHDKSQSRQGIVYYSESSNDLGNQSGFDDYLKLLTLIFSKCLVKLNKNKFFSIVVSDFTVNKVELNVSGILIREMQKIGLKFVNNSVIVQNQKSIYPFGYPYDYVINHINQNVLTFYK